jgi:hypothetical protein
MPHTAHTAHPALPQQLSWLTIPETCRPAVLLTCGYVPVEIALRSCPAGLRLSSGTTTSCEDAPVALCVDSHSQCPA